MPRRICVAASQHGGGHAYECKLCGVRATSAAQLQRHLKGRYHKQAVRLTEAPEFAEQAEASRGSLETMNGWLKRLGHEEAGTKSAARRELQNIHVNIYDLVNGETLKVFKSVPKLAQYSYKTGKIFPRKAAKESHTELRQFLRHFDEDE